MELVMSVYSQIYAVTMGLSSLPISVKKVTNYKHVQDLVAF
jgi:hypothetical protein